MINPYKLPSLYEVKTAKDFFKEFIELNKSRKNFSQRGFSKKLNWPISYISDIISGRRNFTVQRAVEFSQFLNLDTLDFEKIIFLSVQNLFPQYQDEIEKVKNLKNNKIFSATSNQKILSAKIFLVFECINWLKDQATFENILELNYRQKIEKVELKKILQILIENKLTQINKSKYINLVDTICFDDKITNEAEGLLHKEFSEFFQNYLTNKIGPANYMSSVMQMSRESFNELSQKLISLRNWTVEVAKRDSQITHNDKDVRVFQLDLNITPCFSKETAALIRGKSE